MEDDRRTVEIALDGLVADLVENRPVDAAAYTDRLQNYLESNPSFYGGAVALVDPDGAVVASPYVYRSCRWLHQHRPRHLRSTVSNLKVG